VRERVDGAHDLNGSAGSGWVSRVWTRERVEVWRVDGRDDEAVLVSEGVNEVGMVPAVVHYNTKPLERRVAVSDLQDVAWMQRRCWGCCRRLR
jgi:hypothetical protein